MSYGFAAFLEEQVFFEDFLWTFLPDMQKYKMLTFAPQLIS